MTKYFIITNRGYIEQLECSDFSKYNVH